MNVGLGKTLQAGRVARWLPGEWAQVGVNVLKRSQGPGLLAALTSSYQVSPVPLGPRAVPYSHLRILEDLSDLRLSQALL
jgi:hypothetical protein